jgi:arginyl-tRNA synthetase
MGKGFKKVKLAIDILEEKISAAMAAGTGQKGCAAIVKPSADAKFGDYQANGVMALAKKIKTNPRKLAEEVVKNLNVDDICEPPEIAGPGFINLRLKADFIAERLLEINADSQNQLGIDRTPEPKTVVVDFSGPNIAKQMHVGHLRSTIIGDCICRMLEFLGHKVIRQNHIGDWGTQFGILIAYQIFKNLPAAFAGVTGGTTPQHSVQNLEGFYRAAQELYDSNPSFAGLGRNYVVLFQKGDPDVIKRWKEIVGLSRNEIYPIYERLNITLERKDERGESFYKDMLADVVGELKKKGLAVESDGAICVFPPGFKNKEGKSLPLIIQKSDGAYLYATTDLAAIRYRIGQLKADRIIYVTDARQQLHFEMVFAVAKMAGWTRENTELIHVTFGSVLGENGRPLKTREGENVKLKELLDEAIERARKIVDEKNPDLPEDKKDEDKKRDIANAVGIGAVKYADYSNNRTSDYIFSFDKMLAMDGNTAPYMQYAYARIRSIERKAESRDVDIESELAGLEALSLTEPSELDLAKYLIRYGEAVEAAAADYRPNYLTAYLYELAQKFSVFYTNCPVLDAEPDKRPTRLLLCDLTARTIEHGLSELLGIEVVEQM